MFLLEAMDGCFFRARMFFLLKHRTFTQNAMGLDMFLVHWHYFVFLSKYLVPLAQKFILYWVSFLIISQIRTSKDMQGRVFLSSLVGAQISLFYNLSNKSRIFLNWLLLSPALAEKLPFHYEMQQVKIMNI